MRYAVLTAVLFATGSVLTQAAAQSDDPFRVIKLEQDVRNLEAANWDRLRTGMSELEVIGLLGPPTSMRQEGDARVLLYAREIGSSGFLNGSVSLRDHALVEVHNPMLK